MDLLSFWRGYGYNRLAGTYMRHFFAKNTAVKTITWPRRIYNRVDIKNSNYTDNLNRDREWRRDLSVQIFVRRGSVYVTLRLLPTRE